MRQGKEFHVLFIHHLIYNAKQDPGITHYPSNLFGVELALFTQRLEVNLLGVLSIADI